MVEEDRPNVVQMPIEGEETTPSLIRPDLDLVVVPSRNKQRLRLMEVNTSYWPVMLFESVNECAHPVVP